MKEIKLLMEHIEDELEDAHTYAELALEYKEADPETAELFYKLSGEEMNHMNALHKAVVSHIEEYRKQKGEPPEAMMAVYEYLHKRDVERAEKIGVLQNMYKR
jgi:hypothetical protein